MSTLCVEPADFDTKLFGLQVGRLEVDDEASQFIVTQGNMQVMQAARCARDSGYDLLYLTSPSYNPQNCALLLELESALPGVTVDMKTTYRAPLQFFSKHKLQNALLPKDSIGSSGVSVIPHKFDGTQPTQPLSQELRSLSLASGEYSRFRTDSRISSTHFEAMYTAWVQNSIDRKVADETFVAIDDSTGVEVGFVTVKCKGKALIDVGLLAVAASHRRRGIASMLLSKATLWAIDKIGHLTEHNPTVQVVTQASNVTACKAYEKFGFTVSSVQIVNHVWLPHHIDNALHPVRDRAQIPYCRQFMTGNEKTYVLEILNKCALDSASRFTTLCSKKLKHILNGGLTTLVSPSLLPIPIQAPFTAATFAQPQTDTSMSALDTVVPHAHSCAGSLQVVITNSGTAALEMAAILCDMQPGDEVLLPSYTFSSTANAFVLRGAVPVFVDIRADTLNIDETLLEAAITSRTRVICCVHYAGIACEMDTIMRIAHKYGLKVVEDAAQAFLATYKGRQLGTIGHFGCFSFHYTKNVICGEGGALSVNSHEKDVSRALILWEKGTNRYDFMSGKIDKYEWVDVGSSHVPSETNCAILYAQLEQCDVITAKRLTNFRYYQSELARYSHAKVTTGSLAKQPTRFRIPYVPAQTENNAHIFYLIFASQELRIQFSEKMKKAGIAVFSHYVPLHSAPAGLKYGRVGKGSEAMSVTNAVFAGLLRLPIWAGLTTSDLRSVVDAVKNACDDLFGL